MSPTPDPADLRQALRQDGLVIASATRPDVLASRHRRQPRLSLTRPAVVVVHLQPLPVRAAWHDRILDVARDVRRPRRALLLDNPNDGERYPRDSFEAMQERVPARRRVAGSVPARRGPVRRPGLRGRTTPDVFVIGRDGTLSTAAPPTRTTRIRARGRRGCAARSKPCSPATRADPAETEPVGCSVKWK